MKKIQLMCVLLQTKCNAITVFVFFEWWKPSTVIRLMISQLSLLNENIKAKLVQIFLASVLLSHNTSVNTQIGKYKVNFHSLHFCSRHHLVINAHCTLLYSHNLVVNMLYVLSCSWVSFHFVVVWLSPKFHPELNTLGTLLYKHNCRRRRFLFTMSVILPNTLPGTMRYQSNVSFWSRSNQTSVAFDFSDFCC